MPPPPVFRHGGAFLFLTQSLFAVLAFVMLAGCGPSVNRYLLIDASLRAHDPKGADAIVQRAEKEYGDTSRVLYGMDRGMTLQLAGDYQQSNIVLEQAEEELDRLYTRKIRTEALAFMANDTALPYEGDPYEQVLINVLKALNYSVLGQWQEALVEPGVSTTGSMSCRIESRRRMRIGKTDLRAI